VNAYSWLEDSLASIKRANWYRLPRTAIPLGNSQVVVNGQTLVNFASNNYLGLAHDPRLKASAIAAIEQYGTGTGSSRLIVGTNELHRQLEAKIAQWKGAESALVFSSGYLANLGAIAALVGSQDIIFSDELNHSCLRNGAKLSGATVVHYKHGNLRDLQTTLEQYRSQYRRALILTDSVFSMDGDIAPLAEIKELADHYSAMLLVDEAHGAGIFGKHGAGVVSAENIAPPLIQMGTLSKALGSLGGYIAGEHRLIDFLRNRCATWIYTTGLSPADTASALTAINILQTEPQRIDRLWSNCQLLQEVLQIPVHSPIVPVAVGNISQTIDVAKELQNQGFLVPAIRPPTVPTPRLRISLMADHTEAQIRELGAKLLNLMVKTEMN
jgi:8-amino-7-oxononanoate synthase